MELLGVIVILGIIITLAVSGYTKYLSKGRNVTYKTAESSLKSAAVNAMMECLTHDSNKTCDEVNKPHSKECFCRNVHMPENYNDFEIVSLAKLIEYDYIEPIHDAKDTESLCDYSSFVYVKNEAENGNNNKNLKYTVCLKCPGYENTNDAICNSYNNNEDDDIKFTATCSFVNEKGEEVVFNENKWYTENLYLKLGYDGEPVNGISKYLVEIEGTDTVTVYPNKDGSAIYKTPIDSNKTYIIHAFDSSGKKDDLGNYKQSKVVCSKPKIDTSILKGVQIYAFGAVTKEEIDGNKLIKDVWQTQDIILEAELNPKPKSVASGYEYQWYKNDEPITEWINNKSLTINEGQDSDGEYYVKVRSVANPENIKESNRFYIKIDSFIPTLIVKEEPISLGTDDYNFLDNIEFEFGRSNGTISCDPAESLKTGSYDVTCTAKGNNDVVTEKVFVARHNYAASDSPYSCCTGWRSYECSVCKGYNYSCCCRWAWDDACADTGGKPNCAPVQSCTWSGCCCEEEKTTCSECSSHGTCHNYSCPNGGTLSGSICYY